MARIHHQIYLILLLLSALGGRVRADEAKRQHILATREDRRMQLERRLEESRKEIENHHTGKQLLSEQRLNHLQQRISVYEHQVGHMSKDLDEEEIQQKIAADEERRRIQAERRKHMEL